MSDGKGCKCYASYSSECVCDDVDWTPSEVVALRDELAAAKARIKTLEEDVEELGEMADCCVYNKLNRVCSYCQCKRKIKE